MANVKFRCRHKVGQQGKRPIYCNMPLMHNVDVLITDMTLEIISNYG